MTSESDHHISGSLGLAVVLAVTAGFVDAYIYQRVTPVFVANMSGNLIRLGMAGGQFDMATIAAALIALTGFLAGAMIATSSTDASLRAGRRPHPTALLCLESTLLLAVAVSIVTLGVEHSASMQLVDYPVVVLATVAMGIQAVALRRVGVVAVSTTFGTGAVVRLGEKTALALRRAQRPGALRRRITIAVLAAVLFAYVAGAAIASALGTSVWPLVGAAIFPAVAASVNDRYARSS